MFLLNIYFKNIICFLLNIGPINNWIINCCFKKTDTIFGHYLWVICEILDESQLKCLRRRKFPKVIIIWQRRKHWTFLDNTPGIFNTQRWLQFKAVLTNKRTSLLKIAFLCKKKLLFIGLSLICFCCQLKVFGEVDNCPLKIKIFLCRHIWSWVKSH